MERDITLRIAIVKRKSKKYLLWNPFENKPGHILKSEFLVVLWMSDKTAALGTYLFQL